jgi:tetratricopeptide (TPR) repeat protein
MDNFKKYCKIASKCESKNELNLAIDNYKKALNYKSNSIKCLKALSNVYDKIGDYNNAIECYKTIINVSTNVEITVISLSELGVLYNKIQNYTESLHFFKKIIHYKNDIPDVYLNMGLCYISLKQYKQAEVTFLIYLKMQKDDKICSNAGNLYFYMKQYDKSIFFYEQITNIKNDYTSLYNLCFPYLAKKNFRYGFELYEYRLKFNNVDSQTKEKTRAEVDIPYWNGVDPCEKLMVIYEQGIGDNILYYRFIIQLSLLHPNLKITYFCKNTISHLFKSYDNITILDDKFPLFNIHKEFNYKVYIMSLPYLLKIDNIYTNKDYYINIDSEKDMFWNNKVQALKGESNKLNVGFVYKGALSSFIEKNISLQEFESLVDLNINLICLHKKSEIYDDLQNISFSDKIISFDIDADKAFEDTISILKNIDILISIDTSIVHLAGVLNVKTLLLLGYGSDWRWFSDNTKVWYDSVNLLRMNENTELKYILPQVKDVLSNILIQQNSV